MSRSLRKECVRVLLHSTCTRPDHASHPFECRIHMTLHRVMLELIPPAHLRKPLTWREVPAAFAYIIPLYFLAYLARRRETRIIRLLLLPTIIATSLRGTFNYSLDAPEYAFLNWVRGTAYFAFRCGSRLKTHPQEWLAWLRSALGST